MPTFGSLFAGIGGLDLGLERAGWTVRWQVENDTFCQRVLAKHWPDVPRYGDIRTLTGDELERVDLVAGGFPCQPVSVAGKRLGQDDERWLWPEFARLVRVVRPRLILVENVPGLLQRGMGDVLGDLASSGYDAEWDCISASAVGAPHRRDRVWLVAYPVCGGSRSAEPWQQQATRSALAHPGRPGNMAHAEGSGLQERHWSGGAGLTGSEHRGQAVAHSTGSGLEGCRVSDGDDAAAGGYRRGELAGSRRGVFALPHTHSESLGRLAESRGQRGQWATEPDVGRVAHGVPARVDRLRGLGNAVVPQVAEWIGRRLLEVMNNA